MKIHELKLDEEYFDDVESGLKTFEIRKNDRNYNAGDLLALSRFKNGHYLAIRDGFYLKKENAEQIVSLNEADTILMEVAYITDYEQKDGYVVMGIKPYLRYVSADLED
ncbi:hypothetical protein [Leuconostoc phage LLC-1]|nr:hypothetical protein [Leuconostoc phage LLC-1]